MRKYYVYLDESGDFDKDLDPDKGLNPSLVGGFFYDKEKMPNTNALENCISSIMKDENHATEIRGEKKGELVHRMLTTAKDFSIEYVIFQNDVKRKIVNSTQTYLTVITEGLIQLMKSLVISENDAIELNVIAGFKKDTTQKITSSYVDGYISQEDYQKRLVEKLAIEKAKLRNDLMQRCNINIKLADDKRNTCLVLCDYVCNFWYTRQARAFSGRVKQDGQDISIRTALKALYKPNYVFPLFNTQEDEHVIRMIQDGFYADALFEVCADMLTEVNCEKVRNSFVKLRKKQIHRQLENLSDYIGDVILFKQDNQLVERVLNKAVELYEFLKENGAADQKFYLDIKLYTLAYLNNTAQYERMELLFKSLEKDVAAYTTQNLDFEYMLMYYTRWAVYLLDNHRYDESCDICEHMELMLEIIEEDIRKNSLLKLEGESRSEQLGKVLGTKLQAQIGQCYKGISKYEEARETSDKAMAQFVFPYDLKRQYQYRAELEAVCGKPEAAMEWLTKSFEGTDWKTYISSNRKNIFDIYNLLYVAGMAKQVDASLSVEIADFIYNTCKADIQKNENLSNICNLFMGYSMLGDSKKDARGRAILEKIVSQAAGNMSLEVLAAKTTLENGDGIDVIMGYGN